VFREKTTEIFQDILLQLGKSIFLLDPAASMGLEALQCPDRECRARCVKEALLKYGLLSPVYLPEQVKPWRMHLKKELAEKMAYQHSDSAYDSDESGYLEGAVESMLWSG
jgi:hypothetical protein